MLHSSSGNDGRCVAPLGAAAPRCRSPRRHGPPRPASFDPVSTAATDCARAVPRLATNATTTVRRLPLIPERIERSRLVYSPSHLCRGSPRAAPGSGHRLPFQASTEPQQPHARIRHGTRDTREAGLRYAASFFAQERSLREQNPAPPSENTMARVDLVEGTG